MKKIQKYKTAVWILCGIVVVQWIFIILISRPKKITPVIKGKIAIVIDDWGYNLNNLFFLEQIKYPLTIAILPNLTYSRQVGEKATQKGLEIILHLPLEPQEKFGLEKKTIMTSMNEAAMRRILTQDLAGIPDVKGVSNHMGSRFTEDYRAMEVIFSELKKRKLYFLDSFVSSESICFDLAHKMGLRFAKRDVFLDNIEETGYIRDQISKLKNMASLYGQAIGIGHDRKSTLEVLKEVMPQLEQEGYKLAFVSELIR